MHRSTFNIIWKRWYNANIKNSFFQSVRGNKSGLLLNSRHDSIAKTLWKYFNAPGNITFVTCNLVTFAGFVTMNSMATTNWEKLAENKLIKAEKNLEIEVQNGIEPKESPLTEYTTSNFRCPAKSTPLATYDSQMAKMSIFHMLYAFYLYRNVLISVEDKNPQLPVEWKKEIEYLKVNKFESGTCTRKEMDIFYNAWKSEFLQIFADLNKSQRFNLPTWQNYPKHLKFICSKLHYNTMENIHDFAHFYNQVPSKGFKRLLRRWLLDYSHLVSTTLPTSDENFYKQLLKDSQGDEVIFNKFASLLLNPLDSRRACFLPKQDSYQIRSASIDTVLLVLRGYVHQREQVGKNHNGAIVRLLSMLRKDSMVDVGEQPRSKAVRIMLPTDDQRDFLEMATTPQIRKKTLALVSHHPEVMELLDSISNWHRPS